VEETGGASAGKPPDEVDETIDVRNTPANRINGGLEDGA
jgi:hypothetical protein